MPPVVRLIVLEHAIGWANNMLVEAISNHGGTCSDKTRNLLRSAVSSLNDAALSLGEDIRKGSGKP